MIISLNCAVGRDIAYPSLDTGDSKDVGNSRSIVSNRSKGSCPLLDVLVDTTVDHCSYRHIETAETETK